MTTQLRATYWTRYPDEATGPLWAAVHVNVRAGVAVPVGVEVWTEPPGDARTSLGPPADRVLDLLPWAPRSLVSRDLAHISVPELLRRLAASLDADEEPLRQLLSARTPGRGRLYGDDHYERVAAVYQSAVSAGRNDPTRAVAERWVVARGTARRWATRARALGFL